MQRPIVRSAGMRRTPPAASAVIPALGPTPPHGRPSASSSSASTNASPSPGVCQTLAMSCQTYAGSAAPAMSVAHERMRSGRRAARRWTWPPPQSWPTRSIGRRQLLHLGDQPGQVVVGRRPEVVGDGRPEARRGQRHDVVATERGPQRVPDGGGLGVAMDEGDGHRRQYSTFRSGDRSHVRPRSGPERVPTMSAMFDIDVDRVGCHRARRGSDRRGRRLAAPLGRAAACSCSSARLGVLWFAKRAATDDDVVPAPDAGGSG